MNSTLALFFEILECDRNWGTKFEKSSSSGGLLSTVPGSTIFIVQVRRYVESGASLAAYGRFLVGLIES